MSNSPYQWADAFQQQKADFVQRCQERLVAMRTLLHDAQLRTTDLGVLNKLMQHFHQMAGSGGIYSMLEFCQLAGRGEELCLELLEYESGVGNVDAIKLTKIMVGMERLLRGEDLTAGDLPESSAPEQAQGLPVVLCVSNDSTFETRLGPHLSGFSVQASLVASAAIDSIKRRLPSAVILELPIKDASKFGFEIAECVKSIPGGDRVPVICLLPESQFRHKIMAIRSGADAIFEQPYEYGQVTAKLASLLEMQQSCRILSVEDDPDQSMFIKTTLESAGHQVISLSDPAQFEETLLRTRPDLLLLDVVLGDINGFELAKLVRQNERFATMPIVFLTTQNHLNAHIAAARVGSDDYLIKPVPPQLLAATVAGRVERHRSLRNSLRVDPLTQCLNFTAFMEEFARLAQPNPRRFSLCMLIINLDGTSEVNEQYGYAVGDQFIATLAKILHETFRHSAVIGRIVGDEFAVVVENVDEHELKNLTELIMKKFDSRDILKHGVQIRPKATAALGLVSENPDPRQLLSLFRDAISRGKRKGGKQIITVPRLVATGSNLRN